MEPEEKTHGIVLNRGIALDEKSNDSESSKGVFGSKAFRKMIVKEYVRPNILDDIQDSFTPLKI